MIGVYIRRRSDFKILGSTLDAITARNMEWQWIVDDDGKEPPQPRDFIRWDHAWRSNNLTGMACILAADASYIPAFSCPVVTIPYFWDNRLAPQPPGRIVCYTSERHLRFVQGLHPGTPDGPIVGWTEADAYGQSFARGLLMPKGTHWVAALYTMKRRVPDPWRHSMRGRLWYWATCRHIRRDVRARNGTLLVKSRVKHGDPRWLQKLSHYIGNDLDMYPSTSWQVLALATEVHHFMSGVAWEAMVAGVPHRVIRVPRPHLAGLPGQAEIDRTIDGTVSREEFLRDWIGVLDGKAGERVCDVIEEHL